MNLAELKQWLRERIAFEERNLEELKEANRGKVIPDLVSRRVIETQILDFRNILHKIEE